MPSDLKLEKTKVTCMDVAKLAGVTIGTVSRVVNGATNVTPENQQKVLRAIKALNYRPSSAARMLARSKCETIGLLIEDGMEDSYYTCNLIRGVSQALSAFGHRLNIGQVPIHVEASSLLDVPILKNHSVDGLIADLVYVRGAINESLSQLNVPCVYVNTPDRPAFNAIIPDDIDIACKTTDYLIARGHRRIAYLPWTSDTTHPSQADRIKGYAQAMVKAGLPLLPDWDVLLPSRRPEDIIPRVKRWIQDHQCTGVVTFSGASAADLFRACYQMGLRVPQDISIMSCDDDQGITYMPVLISCYVLQRHLMGRMAVEMLLDRIEHPDKQIPSKSVYGVLMERDSVKTISR